MSQGIRPYVTTGIALVGAGAIAVAPITAPPPEVHATPIATTQRVVTADVQLAALTSLADYTFADAALLTGNAVFINLPLLAVVLPTTVAIAFASGVGVPELGFLVVNRFVTIPLDIARPWAAALANSLPEPLGGVPVEDSNAPGQGAVFDSFHAVNDAVRGLIVDIFAPNQALAQQRGLPGIVAQKAVEPTDVNELPGGSGNVVDLTLPDPNKKVEDGGNLIVSQGSDLSNGGTVTKSENNRPKAGSNVRAVVKEVRKEMRETVKDFRQGVRDVVKTVTGLGKKKEVTKHETSTPGE